MKKKLEVIS